MSFGDRVQPFLELDVVGADEPLAPVGRHPAGVLALPLDDDPAALGEFDGAGLTEDLAADVIPVGDVHGRLDVHQGAVGHLQHQDQRVLQLFGRQAAAPRVVQLGRDDLGSEKPAGGVDVMHAGVDDDALGGHAVRDRGIAVRRVEHQRRTDIAAVQGLLHGPVAVVVAAHEADHDQPPAGGHLGVQDPFTRLLGGRERLLAEHLLAGGDARQHVLLVGATPGGDDDGIDVRGVDQFLSRLVELGAGDLAHHVLGPNEVHIGDPADPGPGQHLGEAPDVVLPDHPDANDADVHSHVKSLPDKGLWATPYDAAVSTANGGSDRGRGR